MAALVPDKKLDHSRSSKKVFQFTKTIYPGPVLPPGGDGSPMRLFSPQKTYASVKRQASVKYYSGGSKSSDTLEKLQTLNKKVEMPKVPVGFQFSLEVSG